MPIAARAGASEPGVADLRVRYLLLAAGTYRIIDRGNRVADGGRFHVNETRAPATLDIIGEQRPRRRPLGARRVRAQGR